jgi:cysteinyl-tRNA synthetase
MALRFYNTLTQQLEPFAPLSGNVVRMYTCGPTVYNFVHIGNLRTFTFQDILRRWLHAHGYQLDHVMNITDVEDKIIKRVHETGVGLREYVSQYEDAFLEDLQTLGCLRPTHLPRATEHIPEMIQIIDALVRRGIAYQAPDGSVYFSIEFPSYESCITTSADAPGRGGCG